MNGEHGQHKPFENNNLFISGQSGVTGIIEITRTSAAMQQRYLIFGILGSN